MNRLQLSKIVLQVISYTAMAIIAAFCFMYLLSQMADRGVDREWAYIAENGCEFTGYSRDGNGALPGGVFTLYQCNDGLPYRRYGQFGVDRAK
jgi:hypothetical protein